MFTACISGSGAYSAGMGLSKNSRMALRGGSREEHGERREILPGKAAKQEYCGEVTGTDTRHEAATERKRLAYMLSAKFQPCDVMDSKHQSLCPPFPCTTANGSRGLNQPSSSPETGVARPKPPVKPKPCVLPKPAMPAKPAPGQRPALSEVPSAEKINLLAGPKPYSSGAGNAVKRLSFGLRCPPRDATNGKEASSTFPLATKPSGGSEEGTGPEKKFSVVEDASGEECGELSSIRKGTVPFKVKPVPVAAKPERFPGTTVEEILAKIEKPNKEGVNSPDRPRLVRSFFSLDGGTAVHLGPKGYTAFRRCSSGREGGESELEGLACHSSHEVEESMLARSKEDTISSNGQHIPESEQLRRTPERDLNFLSRDSSSGQRSMSCDGGQPGRSSPQSPPGASFPQIYQPLAELSSEIAPGSPDAPAQPVQLPGSPYHSATNFNLPPGSPDAPTQPLGSPVQISCDLAQAPGSPVALADQWPPGSPTTSIKTFLGHTPGLSSPSARCPEAFPLPEPSFSVAPASPIEHSLERPSCLLGVFESPGSPSTRSEYCLGSDQPPGSPSHIQDPLLFRVQDPHQNHAQTFPSEDKGPQHSQLVLRRASEGVVQPQSKGMTREELGGSLAVLPKGGGHPIEQTAGGESNWSLSQSFEWSFPNRPYDWGGKRLGSPPRSPIKEAEDTGSLETELGEDSPSSKVSYEERNSDGLDRRSEEVEFNEKSAFPEKSNDSLRSGMEAEEQPESPSAIGMPAPGGPSAQMKPTNLKLKGFSEGSFEEERDDLLPFAPIHKEGALGAMEPLPSLGQTAPPTQPCILFLKDAQMKTEASCQDDDSTLGLAQEGKTGDSDPLRGIERDPGSHWLDELLASPPPSADDAKRKSTPKSEDPAGPEGLLGWSRKDLSSEFGIVEASQPETFGMGWSDAPDIGKVEWPVETEQDREFGTGKRDWLSSYGIDDTNEQEMEFGTNQQNWTGGTPLLGNSNIRQEDWLTAYGSSCAGQQIGELDWSSGYGIDAAESQDREPYVRKPGWPRLCNADTTDLENSEFAAEKTDWSSQYPVGPVEKADWSSKCSPENANCPETEITTTLSDESGKYSTASHQDTQLGVMRSEGPDDCRIVEVTSQDTAFSARPSDCPSESDPDSSANKGQIEFNAQKVEQPSEYNANLQESQDSTKQQPRPNTYGFGDVSSQESELSFKQPDWPSKYDLEVAHCQGSEFSAEKPDETSEHNDSRKSWASELGIGNRDSTTECEASNLEFCAQKPVWTDEYRLSGPHSSDFPASTRDWAKDTDVFGTKRENPYGATGNDQAGTFGPLDLPGLKVTIDLGETADKTGDLRIVAMDEPRGIGEGQPDVAQDLGLGGMDLSSDLKFESPDTSKKPTEKQPDWFPALGLESLPVSSAARSLNPEEFRQPGVGQADFPYRSGIEGMNVSDLQSKDLDAFEELDPMQMDWTGKTGMVHKDFSYHNEATGLNANKIQHPEASEYSGKSSSGDFHSQRLSSPSHLLDEMIANSAGKELPQEDRPLSFQSCLSEEEKGLNSLADDQVSSTEKTGVSPLEEHEKVWPNGDGGLSQLDGATESQPLMEARVLSHSEQNGSQAARPMSQESTAECAGVPPGENFIFLEDTEVLDSAMFRDRANVGRKRGHRAPVTRSGGALSESDRDSWIFKDSTEPRVASAVSDEETPEEPRSRKSRNSPLPKGVKVPLFPGLNPSALKAKLRGRNRSAEEGDTQGEVKQTSAKETHVQRSKSCKINVGGKPLVLPPKPEKSSG
ncbi:hypothetical protein lerEdw1_011272 [Lerista edwardsae]|nr:hypothetical protein lerEdw1_011272 [Lerista edwardsae]